APLAPRRRPDPRRRLRRSLHQHRDGAGPLRPRRHAGAMRGRAARDQSLDRPAAGAGAGGGRRQPGRHDARPAHRKRSHPRLIPGPRSQDPDRSPARRERMRSGGFSAL
ncbi:MAG: hypothetical protein AVDCRST_MAG23-2197, partial [uncultured Sphingosinicella sp.]